MADEAWHLTPPDEVADSSVSSCSEDAEDSLTRRQRQRSALERLIDARVRTVRRIAELESKLTKLNTVIAIVQAHRDVMAHYELIDNVL